MSQLRECGDRVVDRPPATYRAIVLECSGLPFDDDSVYARVHTGEVHSRFSDEVSRPDSGPSAEYRRRL